MKTGLLIAVGLALVLVACGPAAPTVKPTSTVSQAPDPPFSLEGSEWILSLLNGTELKAGTNITLGFVDGKASGFAGCNAYGGTYSEPEAGRLSLGQMAVTAQGCLGPEGVMEQEQAYIQALLTGVAYQVAEGHLEIQGEGGEILLVFDQKEEVFMNPADLVGTTWQLISFDGQGPVEGSSITLGFRDDRHASGHAGCRNYAATYEARGDDIRFPSLAMTGDEACLADDALYQQEGHYTDALSWATNYRLTREKLELLTARGEVLVFEPALPETEPEAEAAHPDGLPTNACTSPAYMVWSSHELAELSSQFQAALKAAGLEGAEGVARAFGEDWYENDSGAGEGHTPCNFSVMQTDFFVTLRDSSLVDRESLGESMVKMLAALAHFPPEETPGPQPGSLDVTFVEGEEREILRVLVTEALEAWESNLTGAALMDVLGYPPEVPGFGPSCQAYLDLVVTAGGVESMAVVTSYRCQNATIDSTGQSPSSPPDLTLDAGGRLDFRLGAGEIPDKLELRLYPEAGIAASFFRWPEELPLDIEPVERVDLEPTLAFEYRPEVPAGTYSLLMRAIWGGDVDVFYAFSFEVR